ncbi:hypothetical protein [Erythrobacter sp. F6033]|uniref:hypothetical protein n=1 Tax=Erythrobacter sp. F6033 TaxID=2926401 RepID=UPI001FF2F533|nr:hypothetical protein [Erythrobacter sp. F6033]MCK0127965.1 hypothetical protein [Erythrobacter sp. F6033]
MSAAVLCLASCGGSIDAPSEAEDASDQERLPAEQADLNQPEAPDQAVGDAKTPGDSLDMTCDYPVKAGDTLESLQSRLGDNFSAAAISIGEGFTAPGAILWPNDPERRMEVVFSEETAGTAEYVRFADEAKWQVGGLGIGDSAAKVEQLNGAPFNFFGFEWDYGGNLSDMGGGRLSDLGGCSPILSLNFEDPEYITPDQFIGDRAISSDADGLPADQLTIWRLGITF